MTVETDPCRNPDCRFRGICPLRPSTVEKTSESVFSSSHRGASLHVDNTWAYGRILMLRVDGGLSSQTNQIIDKALQRISTADGLLVKFNSLGGLLSVGQRLQLLIQIARDSIPTVSFIEKSMSAALLPALSCDRVFASPGAELGVFGFTSSVCDGHEPGVVISRQAPKKIPHLSRLPTILIRDAVALAAVQDEVDRLFETELSEVTRTTGRSADELRPLLDGRHLTAQEVLEVGLITHIGFEHDALWELCRLM